MKTWQYTGLILVAIGIIHTLFAVVVFWPLVEEMINDGFVNSVADAPESKFAVHWFLLSGYFWVVTGVLCHWIIRRTHTPLPLFFGVLTLMFGLVGGAFQPISGTWVFVPLGLFIIYSARKARSTASPSLI